VLSDLREKLLQVGLFWLRNMVGLGIAHHGYGKIFGGHLDKFAESVSQMGFPMPMTFAWAAALSEFVGGILLILGLGTRFAAFFVFITMGVALFDHHRLDPLKVKELAAAYWAITGTLILTGPGQWSLDNLFISKRS
jgi:putative oxidoreductase